MEIKSKHIQVDGLIAFDIIDTFDDDGNYDNTFLRLSLPSYLLTDDFAFCYNSLNGMGYRINTKTEFVHTLMAVYSDFMVNIIKSLKTVNFVKSGDDDEGYA